MKKIKVLLMLLVLAMEISAQSDLQVIKSDTVFYKSENGFLFECGRKGANGYSISASTNSDIFVNKIYYLHTQQLMAEYEMYERKITNPSNDITSTLVIKNGKYEEFYISGEKRVSCFYTENKLNGEFKVFYQNGHVKRLEQWQNGQWQNGECFDEQGNNIPYCSYQEPAAFDGGFSELFTYISNTLVYPKEALRKDIEGKVYVSFVIDRDGSVTNVKIAKGVNELLDTEAIRIVNNMPKWKPGRFEGNLVRFEFTLPINFKLE